MIVLKPLKKNDVTPFYDWINDKEVIRYSLSLFLKINTKDEIDSWFNGLILDTAIINLGIFLKHNNKLIGYTGICNISKINKSGEYYIFIGDKTMWEKGIGSLVTKKILKIGFEEARLNRIYLTVSKPNIAGIKAYQKAGFKIEGELRNASFRDNKYHNKVMMSILKLEWDGRK